MYPDVTRCVQVVRDQTTEEIDRKIADQVLRPGGLWPHCVLGVAGNMNRTQETKVDVMDEHIFFKMGR